MMETNAITETSGHSELADKHLCPDCRGVMVEVDRINENGFLFIWYECVRSRCDGQWLEKKPNKAWRT